MRGEEYKGVNLFTLRPVRNLSWEIESDGNVVLIVPKFRSRFLGRWLVPLLRRPNFRVRLDGYGSRVWEQCDGNTTVEEITSYLVANVDRPSEDMEQRVVTFVQRLMRDRFLTVVGAEGPEAVT